MGFKMTSTTKHNTDGRIAKHLDRKFSSFDALEQFLFRSVVVDMQRVLAATALCFLATLLTVTSFASNHFVSPSAVWNSPVVSSMNGKGVYPAAMPSNVPGNTNRGAFHHVSNVDGLIAATGADMSALLIGDPLDGFRGQAFPLEVPMNVSRDAYGLAVFPATHGNRITASAGAQTGIVIVQPSINNAFVGVLVTNFVSHRSLASGELLEPLTGHAEGNQQPSREYTLGRFRDYRSSLVCLITGLAPESRSSNLDMI